VRGSDRQPPTGTMALLRYRPRVSVSRCHCARAYADGMSTDQGDQGRASKAEGPRGGKSTISATGMIRKAVYLHPDEAEALRRRAFEERRPASEIIRELLRQYLGIED